MTGLIPWPFPLPDRFVDSLGYERAAGPMAMPESLRALLVRTNITEAQIAATERSLAARRPRRFVLLYWQPSGDELAYEDGQGSGAGQLDHWRYLQYLHGRRGTALGVIHGWLVEHEVNLGSSEEPATHALIVDRATNRGWVAPLPLARHIVREQRLPHTS
jgi:hypothetical protein